MADIGAGNLSNRVEFSEPIESQIKVKAYNYQLNNVILNQSVSYIIYIYDDLGNDIFFIAGIIEGEEYQNWGNDDAYMESLLEQKVRDYLHPSITDISNIDISNNE